VVQMSLQPAVPRFGFELGPPRNWRGDAHLLGLIAEPAARKLVDSLGG